MENIQHSYVNIRGLNLHIAEIGTGPAVVFLHGFPEIWYSWRHQMTAVADAGFRAIAPDFRGYGLSQQPPEPAKTTFKDMVDDLVLILDLLEVPKVILVGKDFGAKVVYHFALVHPKRVVAVATLGVPFVVPSDPESFRASLPKGFYVLRFQDRIDENKKRHPITRANALMNVQEVGRAEKDFGRFDAKTVFKKIYIMFTASELQVASEDQEIMDLVDESAPLPAWFTEEDLQVYAELYEKSGFQTALQVPYRAWLEGYGVDELKVDAPGLLIMGEEDYALKFAGFDHYIKSGMVKTHVPDLEIIFLPQGTHFVQEQLPDQVNNILIKFLNKHASRQ